MYKKVHCIGIGGIGLSALARYYMDNGAIVSGSDTTDSALLRTLRKEGMTITIGHSEDNVPEDVECVIYSIAIDTEKNEEYIRAKVLVEKNNIQLLSYPEALGAITKNKKTIAICGTHGKTTTTAMTYYALKEAGIHATTIVGSLIDIDGKKTNYIYGDSEYLIIEACEYKRSFLNYHPTYVVITNIDDDHLDYYKDKADIVSAFQSFADTISDGGEVIVHHDVFTTIHSTHMTNADAVVSAQSIELSVFGMHNKENAALVIALGKKMGIDEAKIRQGLQAFSGTWRRMEYKGKKIMNGNEVTCYDDYAHHPTEIKATLRALKEHFPDDKTKREIHRIIALFQPHLYSRTKLLLSDFAISFDDADEVLLLPIYSSREKYDASITSSMLQEKIGDKAQVFDTPESIVAYLNQYAEKGDVLITLGAGDVYDIYKYI